ncbi:MAG: hypothetical protein U0359_01055 [Byssovorax sp.]
MGALSLLGLAVPPSGLPRDPAPIAALLLAPLAFAAGWLVLKPSYRARAFVPLAALLAALLSAAYVALYLRGGPRIIDATSYFLEARAMAEGHLAWPLAEPATSTLGRFLVRSEHPEGPFTAVIFPPGYPALLALGFLIHAPMVIGPLLAAAICAFTFLLARVIADRPTLAQEAGSLSIPRLAAALSVLCAALRYHTADTMSHGLSALCLCAALALVFLALDADRASPPRRRLALSLAAGLFTGWLAATRPVSALALAPVLALSFAWIGRELTIRQRLSLLATLLAGAIPGLLLLLAHQHAATGAFGVSSQRLYYALADGPPGCFRYGFGAGIGCLGEHGDFVRHNLPDGYGAYAALATTLRRLKLHLVDPASAEPLGLLVPLGAILAFREPRVRLLALAIVLQIAAYSPFYFDGNYPGGGARFFADLLPVEHVLMALAVASLAARRPRSRLGPAAWGAGLLALSLLGFSMRAGFDHALLRDREGGRPMFEPAVVAGAGAPRALVFVDTDHGFNLGFDPGATALLVRRFKGDDLDRQSWEASGRLPAYRYRFDPGIAGLAVPTIEPLGFPEEAPPVLSIEGESLFPPIAQEVGWASADHASGTCASAGRWLAIHRASPGDLAHVRLDLPAAAIRGRALSMRIGLGPGARGAAELWIDGALVHREALPVGDAPGLHCETLMLGAISPSAARVELILDASSPSADGLVALDRLDLLDERARSSVDRPAPGAPAKPIDP